MSVMRNDFAFLPRKSKRPWCSVFKTSLPPKGPSLFFFLLDGVFLALGLLADFGRSTTWTSSPLICSWSLRAKASSASTSTIGRDGGVDFTKVTSSSSTLRRFSGLCDTNWTSSSLSLSSMTMNSSS